MYYTPEQTTWPDPGSVEELNRCKELQTHLSDHYAQAFPDPREPRTVVVIPSLTLDPAELTKISGVYHYEERMLCMLMLLRLPRTNLIYVTSQPLNPTIIDYYLNMLQGVPAAHARKRLALLCCYDSETTPLTQKILERPRLLSKIRSLIARPEAAHITCFNATALERTLSLRLGLPLYACDPELYHLGTKSGSRTAFKEAGISLPDGFENLGDHSELVDALCELKRRNPTLRKAVVKLNEGFSGEGNAIFRYEDCPMDGGLANWIRDRLPKTLQFEAKGEKWGRFQAKLHEMGFIVEAFIDGAIKHSPSVQCRIDPLGNPQMISTHDQVLGGPSGQIFLGCTFPARVDYRLDIQDAGQKVANVLKTHGVLGRFGVDFISVREEDRWKHYAIEINLRKGGTTHPFIMLQFLTDGDYNRDSGLYYTPQGQPRFYYATDNLQSDAYIGLTPDDLIDIVVYHNLHFHGATQTGVMFHLIGALSEFGKLGVVSIGKDPSEAQRLYRETVEILDREARR